MKRLTALSVPLLTLAIAGCGEESDQLPVDGREFDGVNYSEPAPYQGRVIDGYLKNARVWLDVDGDGQYTPGPLEVTLDNGNTAVLESGEPTTMSGEGGAFSLDISEFQLPAEVGRALDPRQYPLHAVALPGQTLEQSDSGDRPVEKAFVLSAGPGVTNVTPLTTLARHRARLSLGSYLGNPDNSAVGLAGINLLADYIRGQDDQAHAYARALARFMASQLPEAYQEALSQADSDGTERGLSLQAVNLLAISLVQNAPAVIAVVDEAAGAGGNYAGVVAEALELPEVALELSDPLLLSAQSVYAHPESGTLPSGTSGLELSAELEFEYSQGGQLLAVHANGCMMPSLPELARLIEVNGFPGQLASQWRPAVSLSPQSRQVSDPDNDPDGVVDERLSFDWAEQRITFETSTTCHSHESISPDSTELGGTPEVVYSWSEGESGVEEVVAEITATGQKVRYVPEPAEAPAGFPGYRLEEGDVETASLRFSGEGEQCEAIEDAVGKDHVVTRKYGYDFTGYEPQPDGFTGLFADYDTRELVSAGGETLTVNRLLRYAFLDPALAGLDNVSAEGGFQWVLRYAGVPEQENAEHIELAYLTEYTGNRACGTEVAAPSSAYARVEYDYQRLSEYLLGQLE